MLYTPCADSYLAMPYKEQKNQDVVKIRYFGNLGLGRWEILREIGNTLKQLNQDKVRATLEVYASVTDPAIRQALTIENGCVYRGWVCGDEYLKLLQDADIAVHVESFDEDRIRRTWVSVSTKIADCLGAGKCILAIGSRDLASIDHIKDAAYVVDDLSSLKEQLETLISDPLLRDGLQKKARSLAVKEHNIKEISSSVRGILREAAGSL